jgi:hypothetical protein
MVKPFATTTGDTRLRPPIWMCVAGRKFCPFTVHLRRAVAEHVPRRQRGEYHGRDGLNGVGKRDEGAPGAALEIRSVEPGRERG